MTEMRPIDKSHRAVDRFDAANLDDQDDRRIAVIHLYDAFRALLLAYIPGFELRRQPFESYNLKTRYEIVADCIEAVPGQPLAAARQAWQGKIAFLQTRRDKAVHQENAEVDPARLRELRQEIAGFAEFLQAGAEAFLEASPSFTMRRRFVLKLQHLTWECGTIFNDCSKSPPYVVDLDGLGDHRAYDRVVSNPPTIETLVTELNEGRDVSAEDLEFLAQTLLDLGELRGQLNVLLRQGICPNCGGKIAETSATHSVGDPEDGRGVAFVRVGCDTCDYELHSDTIDIG